MQSLVHPVPQGFGAFAEAVQTPAAFKTNPGLHILQTGWMYMLLEVVFVFSEEIHPVQFNPHWTH